MKGVTKVIDKVFTGSGDPPPFGCLLNGLAFIANPPK